MKMKKNNLEEQRTLEKRVNTLCNVKAGPIEHVWEPWNNIDQKFITGDYDCYRIYILRGRIIDSSLVYSLISWLEAPAPAPVQLLCLFWPPLDGREI